MKYQDAFVVPISGHHTAQSSPYICTFSPHGRLTLYCLRTYCVKCSCSADTSGTLQYIRIPLLPLLAVRPVQSLSACTVQLYLYSPYGPYGLYRASVPVQGCSLPLPLPYVDSNYCFTKEGKTITVKNVSTYASTFVSMA